MSRPRKRNRMCESKDSKMKGFSERSPSYSDPDSTDISSDATDRGPFVQASLGEAYLRAHAQVTRTSDRRFSDFVSEKFTAASYLSQFRDVVPTPDSLKLYEQRFPLWLAELDEGFSICLVGRGSKRPLLEHFAARCLCKFGHVVSVNGYVPSLSLADILDAIETRVLESRAPSLVGEGDRLEQRARAICERYERHASFLDAQPLQQKPLYLVVHSIDGSALRLPKIRDILAMLAAAPCIHLVASMDHLRAPLLFSDAMITTRPGHTTSLRYESEPDSDDEDHDSGGGGGTEVDVRTFNFLFHHTPVGTMHTFEPLIAGFPSAIFDHSVFEPPQGYKPGGNTTAQRVAGTISVLSSLGKDQHDIFAFLAAQQYQTGGAMRVVKLHDRFQLIQPDRFDRLLHEFFDHQIMIRQDDDAILIQLDNTALERILSHAILAAAVERIAID